MEEDKILLIARFMEGDMDAEEQAGFEVRLKGDAALQQLLQQYEDVQQGLKMKFDDHTALKETLKGFNHQYFKEEPRHVRLLPAIKWLSGVAAILITGLLIWAPWKTGLYEQYVDQGKMLVTERSAVLPTDLDQAASFYNEKKYDEAAVLLEKLHIAQPENAMITYYYGLSQLKTDKTDAARTTLHPLYEGRSVFKYEAAYAIALSYLKENRKEECKRWLEKIPAEATRYTQSKALLKAL